MVRPDDTSQGYAGGKFWGQPKQKNFPPQASRSGYQPHSATQPLPRSASAAANLGRSAATPPLPQGGDSHSNNNSNSHSTAATVRFSKPPRVPTEGGPGGGGGGGMLMGTDGIPEPAAAMLLPEHARTAPPPQTNSSRSMADPTDGPIAGWAADTPGSVRTIVLEDDAGPATSAEQEQYMHQQRQHMVRGGGGGGGGGSGSGGGSRANQQRKSETMQAAAQQLDGNSDAEGVPMDIMGAFKDLMHGSAALFQQTMSKVGEKRVKELQREKADHKVRQ